MPWVYSHAIVAGHRGFQIHSEACVSSSNTFHLGFSSRSGITAPVCPEPRAWTPPLLETEIFYASARGTWASKQLQAKKTQRQYKEEVAEWSKAPQRLRSVMPKFPMCRTSLHIHGWDRIEEQVKIPTPMHSTSKLYCQCQINIEESYHHGPSLHSLHHCYRARTITGPQNMACAVLQWISDFPWP
ncbi:hypothetical protein K457DRAFT_21244 [Linnemannia elongata AG-77]|uniref:Uncharacterized protein n=1 Tax=Linnemannia elongata AG-77 TaxID=1314771 RepID=A0A197JSR0_9FUNG|nr:hypothetical protein K457DRAFT_21244 [Linnemannia elongata AG-77]